MPGKTHVHSSNGAGGLIYLEEEQFWGQQMKEDMTDEISQSTENVIIDAIIDLHIISMRIWNIIINQHHDC